MVKLKEDKKKKNNNFNWLQLLNLILGIWGKFLDRQAVEYQQVIQQKVFQ
jgi:hypothetical protein